MKRTTLLFFLTLALLLIGTASVSAQIVLPCPPPPPCFESPCPLLDCPPPVPGVDTDPSTLKIDYHRVNVSIGDQIANTEVDMQFTNHGERLAEGTFIFPLPKDASVDRLTMWVDGEPFDAKILGKDEARQIYNEIVRRYRDPALLEYIDNGAIQANVFPIPPGDSRRIEISYSHVVEVDSGLIHFVYPLNTAGSDARVIGQMSISVDVDSNDPISNIYSPSHPVGISRDSDGKGFRVGYEATNIIPDGDFSLYYGIENESINLNLLTYRESANRDGFFMLLVQPPVEVPDEQIVPKDVIVVLDQSGSMEGEKWDQARKAATYVLDNLNEDDRFNVIPFSTGWRLFSNELAPADEAGEAIGWIEGLWAEGGTDINGALLTALEMAHPERSTTVMFLTDGLATEGEIESDRILENLGASAGRNVQVFTFGVGDDVDTFLLDSIVRDHHGSASYVRPGERIDEEVASLYNKISAPVLTNITLDFDPVRVELLYPTELPDLFAGEQLTLVGRYRDAAEGIDIKLRGEVNNQEQIFIYDNLDFRERAGGEPFIARLWATRRIGDLLNTIRLRGENPELIDSVVNLSIRYGIITPYTSFLIEEDDILSREGRLRANENFAEEAEVLANTSTGASAVDAADDINRNLAAAQSPIAQPTMSAPVGGLGGGNGSRLAPPVPGEEPDADGEFSRDQQGYFGSPIQNVNEKTFLLQDGVWNDTTFDPDNMTTNKVVFLSDEYFELLEEHPELGDYFALGENLIVVIDGVAWEIVPE